MKWILCMFLVQATPLWAQQWEVKTAAIKFEINNAGFPVSGSFSGLEADIHFDPKRPEKGSILASVDATTIDTGIDLRNKHLKKGDYFDVENYPRISMTSVSMKKIDKGAYQGVFKVQIKDLSKEVPLHFSLNEEGSNAKLAGDFQLNRLDFGLGEESIILANEVKVLLELEVSAMKKQ